MDKETILKTLMNILDVKHHQEWKSLDTDNIVEVMKKHMINFIQQDHESAIKEIDQYFKKYEDTFNKPASNISIDCYELNSIREPLIKIKMQYFVNSK